MYKQSGFKAIILITLCTVIGKVLGIIKDSLISYYYGATPETDAFFLALSVPTILLGIFTASTDSAIIPQYKRIMNSGTREDADNLFSKIINTLSITSIVACVFIFIFPTLLIKLFAPGFDDESLGLASHYLKIFAPIGTLHLWYCFFCTYNAAHKENRVRSILAFLNNLIIVAVLVVCKDSGLEYIAYAYLLINFVCAFLPIIEMKKLKYKHSIITYSTRGEYKRFFVLFLPIMGGALLNDIQQYVDKCLSSSVPGGISYLNYGNKLVSVFDSVLIVGVGVVILPMLSDFENQQEYNKMSAVSSKITRMLLEALIPCMSLLFIAGKNLIILLFGRGKFDDTAIDAVTSVLMVYAPLIIFIPLITVFSKFFHVKEKNNIPFIINLGGVILNTLLSVILKIRFGIVGIAVATTIAMAIEIVVYIAFIQKYVGWDKNELRTKYGLGIMLPTIFAIVVSNLFDVNLTNMYALIIKIVSIFFIYLIFYFIFIREDILYIFKKIKGNIKYK